MKVTDGTLERITESDIADWDSLDDIASSLEKRGLKRHPDLGEENELVLQLTDTEFIKLVEGGPGESASDFKPDSRNRRTNLVATNDFEEFTFLTRVRSWEGQQHGRIKHQKLSFTKEQMTSAEGEKNTVLQKLNSLEYGSTVAIEETLYDTRKVVKEFYEQFEDLRTDLVQEVTGIPDDRGDAKRRYVQVVLDRMIFLYFIQEKRLLDRNPNYLHEKHEEIVNDDGNVYEDFYHPLFFEMLAEGKQDPDFGSLPYLNGGLFSKNPVEEEFDDARLGESADRTNELFGDILEFLSDWNWNVDERLDIADPKNLSPAILGHIFEQTVNQKEMGAYYTPEEITGFMARETIHPYLLDRLNETVGADYEEIDDVFGLSLPEGAGDTPAVADGGTVTAQAPVENVNANHVETLYHDILSEARVLDPAVGSGAFLLAAQEVLLDIYVQCIEFFQQFDEAGMGWDLENRTRDELERVESGQGGMTLYAKRKIILNNLYGVDIDEGAVEICKLRLWLSMVADIEDEPNEVEPLPNIDFNIRQGNSLIGFTDVEEIATEDGDASLTNYGGGVGDSVEEMYRDVITAVERHREAESAQVAANARREAEEDIEEHGRRLNKKVLEHFKESGVEDITFDDVEGYSPFHWVLEFATVYRDGGFDVIVGNPPWDVLSASSDEFFAQYDPNFRSLTQDEKEEFMDKKLSEPEVKSEWEAYQQDVEWLTEYFKNSGEYTLQTPEVAGETATYKNDLSKLFFERVFHIVDEDAYVSQVLPGLIVNGEGSKDLRMQLLNETSVESLIEFENNGIFDIHKQQRFAVITFKNSGRTEELWGVFDQKDTEPFTNLEGFGLHLPRRVLAEYSPEARIFPWVKSQREVEVLDKVLRHPALSGEVADGWSINLLPEELNETRDKRKGYFDEEVDEPDYPVYTGSNVYQYQYDDTLSDENEPPTYWSVDEERDPDSSAKRRVRQKRFNSGEPKKAIYEVFGGPSTSKSQIGFVNDLLTKHRDEELSEEDVLLDSSEYRIAYRDVASSTNERTMIATVLPKDVLCVHTLATFRPYEINPSKEDLKEFPLHEVYERRFTDHELFVALGLINSLPFDYLMRTKTDKHLVEYKLLESKVPRLTEGDDWFHYISERASRLNCYGEEFAEMRERLGDIDPVTDQQKRQELRAEIDAAAFHAYGLERRDVQFILEDFHRVDDPRIMTDTYFDLVFEKFDVLEQEGPYE